MSNIGQGMSNDEVQITGPDAAADAGVEMAFSDTSLLKTYSCVCHQSIALLHRLRGKR